MTLRFGEVEGCHIFIMDRATKSFAPPGYVCVQSLLTGETATVKLSMVQNITDEYSIKE
jgi:hypothetical protein